MKPHVILVADAGPGVGWGHAVRQLALAEALVAKWVPVLFVTRTREALRLDWPCPVWCVHDVEKASLPDCRVLVYDLPETPELPDNVAVRGVVRFEDYGSGCYGPVTADYVVCPNFAAESSVWGSPAFLPFTRSSASVITSIALWRACLQP